MKRQKYPIRYTVMDVMMASPIEPMKPERRRHQLTRMWNGLASIETAPAPTTDDWRVCSDAVTALAHAGTRYHKNGVIRLDAQGMMAVRAVLEDYANVLEQLPERTIIQVHRNTEKRIREILLGKSKPHDVEVMDL
jgi:hypothetical protein